ncbi:MAG: N-acetyltransferase [Dysgonamonadaceae bacterium]|jgi:predicted GNAT family acetyltransferase|nr:N-acetyltransferase [Dysgonamonadaceae bacterium]
MKIEHKNSDKKGIFLAKTDEEIIGEMTYVWVSKDSFIIDHTEVSPEYRGKNVGGELVKGAVEFARENDFTIIPLCPFAAAEFERHSEYKDVKK